MKNYQIFFLLHTAVCTFVKSYATALLLLFLCFKLVSAQQAVTIEQINSELDQAAQFAYTARPEKAIPILEKAEAESESMNYSFGVSRAGYTLAIIYFNSSDYNKVINLDEKYLRIGKEAKDHENVSHIHRLKGGAYSELGLLSKGRDEYDEALKYANKMSAGNNKQYALSLIYSNLSSHLLKSAAPQEAIFSSIHQCIAAAEKIDENDDVNISRKYRMIAYAYIIMANEYDKAEDFDLAEDYYLKSLQIQQSHSVPLVEKVVLYNQLGYFYYDRMDFVQSISFAEEGLSIEKKASIPQLRKELFEILSKSYLELDEIEKSKNYFRLFTALNDSLLTSNRVTIDGALYKTISEQKKLSLNNSNKQIIIYTLITLVLLIFGISFFLYQKKQIQIKKIEKVVAQLKEKQKKT